MSQLWIHIHFYEDIKQKFPFIEINCQKKKCTWSSNGGRGGSLVNTYSFCQHGLRRISLSQRSYPIFNSRILCFVIYFNFIVHMKGYYIHKQKNADNKGWIEKFNFHLKLSNENL